MSCCECRKCIERREKRDEEIITFPTETETRIKIKEKVVKHIDPKEIINVRHHHVQHESRFKIESEHDCRDW